MRLLTSNRRALGAKLAVVTLTIFLATSSMGTSGSPGRRGPFEPVVVSGADLLPLNDPSLARQRLEAMGVSYLFLMNGADVTRTATEFKVTDFMDRVEATTGAQSGVSLLECGGDRFVSFVRPRPDALTGGSLLVLEKDPGTSRLESTDAFSYGAWIKLQPTSVLTRYDELTPGDMPRGFATLLSRFRPSEPGRPGMTEWAAQFTSEIFYLSLTKGAQGYTASNVHVPWWADTYGTCYSGRSDECWHFVSVSFDPVKHEARWVVVRRQSNNLPGHTQDFVETSVTDADWDSRQIDRSSNMRLQIGSNGTQGIHGLLRGVFFARRALTPEQMKSIANFTAPSRKGALCASYNMKPVP